MANRFKDFRANRNKTVILTEEEIEQYSNTANNKGVDHSRIDWESPIARKTDAIDEKLNIEKERTILRAQQREEKTENAKGDSGND